jgi:hypothetical protein
MVAPRVEGVSDILGWCWTLLGGREAVDVYWGDSLKNAGGGDAEVGVEWCV